MPAPPPAGLHTALAGSLQSQIAALAGPGSLPMRRESQFPAAALPLAPAKDSPRLRWRSEARTLPLPVASAEQAARSKQLPPATESSQSCGFLGQSCAYAASAFRHNFRRAMPSRPVLVWPIPPVSAGPAGNNCANPALPALPGPTATLSILVRGPVLPAETEIP